MEIIKKAISDLKPSPYNPRKELKPGSPRYERLKKSVVEFDYIDPIIWNRRTDRIVGGHQRLSVLINLGYREVDVSVVDIDENKEKALNLALNKTGGSWDLTKLEDVMKDLEVVDFDIESTGFSESEMRQLGRYMDDDQDSNSKIGELEYQIIITCRDEIHQRELLEKFKEGEIKCRPLIL